MRTAREIFEHIAETLNNDAEDGVMSTTTDDDLVSYLSEWRKEEILPTLLKAKETIKALHGPTAWDIYDRNAPEMKQLNWLIQELQA